MTGQISQDGKLDADQVTNSEGAHVARENAKISKAHGADEGVVDTSSLVHEKSIDSSIPPKQKVAVSATGDDGVAASVDSDNAHTRSWPRNRPWRTLLLQIGPLSGIACLVLAILSLLVSLGILLGSNGAPVVTWSVEPSAILAICTAVANQAMRYAAFQGLTIAWWYRAMRGSTIKKLHTDWRAGMTVPGAVSAGRKMGVLGLACIFSTLVAVDGPLLQKATHVVYAPIEEEYIVLNTSILPEIPRSFFSRWVPGQASYMWNKTIPAPNNRSISNNVQPSASRLMYTVQGLWLRNASLSGGIRGCPTDNLCNLKVKAPALATTACTSYQIPVDYAQPAKDTLVTRFKPATRLDRMTFIIDIQLDVSGEREAINMVKGIAHTSQCAGILNYTACSLESAVAEYDVQVRGDTLVSVNVQSPTIIAIASNTRPATSWNDKQQWYDSTLAGISVMAYVEWEGSS